MPRGTRPTQALVVFVCQPGWAIVLELPELGHERVSNNELVLE